MAGRGRYPLEARRRGDLSALRDYGWLLAGAIGGLLIAWFGLGEAAATRLNAVIPVPWGAIGSALLVFAAFAGLHFRGQLIRSLARESAELERGAAASRLIRAAASDGRRWLRVVQENLDLVSDGSQGEREKELYLGGARANADKLEQAFDRIEGNQRQLDARRGGDDA